MSFENASAAPSSSSVMSHKKKVLLKVLILGDSGVGKTSVMNRYIKNTFARPYKATIGADFTSKDVVVDDKLVTLQIWDTAGQERFQSLGSAFYRGTDACVLTYDMTDAKSFASLDVWMDEFLVHAAPRNADAFPFVVLGNKADLATAAAATPNGTGRAVPAEQAAEWCATKGQISHFETSAKDGANLEQAFQAIAVAALKQEEVIVPPPKIPTKIKLDEPVADATKSACPCG